MNYIKQVKAFYKLVELNSLSTNAQALYNYLLYKDNEFGWLNEFTLSNLSICGFTSLSRKSLDRARNELVQKGFIEYKKGTSNQAGKYLIVSFDTQDGTQDDTQDGAQGGTQMAHTATTLNKLNKTKQNNKKNIKKNLVEYGENKNVKFTDEEFEKVKTYFPNDYMKRIQTLDDYMQSTGKKYKDYFATLKNWARREGYTPPNEKTNIEYKEVKMTEEEYYKNKGGKEYV